MANVAEPGRVECIHVAVSEGEPMRTTDRIRVLAGIGLEGDRYGTGRGHFSRSPGTGRALTLIEAEVLESLRDSEGIALQPGEARRNVTTRGIALKALGVVAKPLLDPLSHRGGLRADVLEDGEIRIGDEISPVEG